MNKYILLILMLLCSDASCCACHVCRPAGIWEESPHFGDGMKIHHICLRMKEKIENASVDKAKDCYSEYIDFLSTGPHWAIKSPDVMFAFYKGYAASVCEALSKFSKETLGDVGVFDYQAERYKLEELSISCRNVWEIEDRLRRQQCVYCERRKQALLNAIYEQASVGKVFSEQEIEGILKINAQMAQVKDNTGLKLDQIPEAQLRAAGLWDAVVFKKLYDAKF